MKMQTLIAFDRAGRVIDEHFIFEGKRRWLSPRIVKKTFKARPDVWRVARITTHTHEGRAK